MTSYYGSPAWNLSLNGAVIVDPENSDFLIDLRESPLKPDKFLVDDKDEIRIKLLNDCRIQVDRDAHDVLKDNTLRITTKDTPVINFIKTKNTRESLMDKILRLNKYQYEQIEV